MSFSHYRPILAGGVALSLLLAFNQPGGSLPRGVHAASVGDQSPADKPASQRAPESASAPSITNTTRRVVQQGVALEFSLQHVEPGRTGPPAEGDDVVFRFQITDAASGAPLSGLDPAGWMNRASGNSPGEPAPAPQEAPSCRKQVESFLSGGVLARADLDLNTYRVLTLNGDATIAAVDPLFGFGRTRLVGLVQLKSPGDDWVLKSDQSTLFVSVPDSDQVAVVDTVGMKLAAELSIGARPARLALQPDEHYLWVSYGSQDGTQSQSGVAVVSVPDLRVVARIATGRGPHQFAFSSDDRFVFVTNREEGSTSVIDIRKLAKVKDIATGPRPSSVAFSSLSGMAYVTDEKDGSIVAIDGRRLEVVARAAADAGLAQIKFAKPGRLGFVVNPERNRVYILDAASNRIIQTGDVKDSPDQLAFSDRHVYIRPRRSETVQMIPLSEVGVEGKSIPVVDFPGGQNAFGKSSRPSLADSIVRAPEPDAVLVANSLDKAVYYYKEGMAAPMGSFSNYGREARAVMVVDRSLRERSPGVYETPARLPAAGLHRVAIFMNTPRFVHCFDVNVAAAPGVSRIPRAGRVKVEWLMKEGKVKVGEPVAVSFKLTDLENKRPAIGLNDVRVLTFLAPGVWHKRHEATAPRNQSQDGVYEIEFVPPRPGIYYVYVESPSLGLMISNSQYAVLEAR